MSSSSNQDRLVLNLVEANLEQLVVFRTFFNKQIKEMLGKLEVDYQKISWNKLKQRKLNKVVKPALKANLKESVQKCFRK